MPTLIVRKDMQYIGVYPVSGTTTIGRSMENDIVLPSNYISREHARILMVEDRFVVVDQGSRDGIWVDGVKKESFPLSHNMGFHIGDYLCVFVLKNLSHEVSQKHIPIDTTDVYMDHSEWEVEDPGVVLLSDDRQKRLIEVILETPNELRSVADFEEFLSGLMEIFNAKRGFILVKDNSGKREYLASCGFQDIYQDFKIQNSILEKTLTQKRCVLRKEALAQTPTPSIAKMKLRSVACVPLIHNDHTIGCLYIDNPDEARCFSVSDRNTLVSISFPLARMVDSYRGEQEFWKNENRNISSRLREFGIIAQSGVTIQQYNIAEKLAKADPAPLIILGETGVGKGVMARYIHQVSGRKNKRFIERNCSSFGPNLMESEMFGHEKGAFTSAGEQKAGILELANHGTVFLDEIAEMPGECQAKLLKAVEDGEIWRLGGREPIPVDVWIISATNKDLTTPEKRKEAGFREDLFTRIGKLPVTIPPLRERREDIQPLAESILEKYRKKYSDLKVTGIAKDAIKILESLPWTGNIRELENLLLNIVLIESPKGLIQKKHIKNIQTGIPLAQDAESSDDFPSLQQVTRQHIIRAMEKSGDNITRASKLLGVSRGLLYRELKKMKMVT